MYIVHCDLKINNILLHIMEKKIINKIIFYIIIKVMYFKLSKVEVGTNSIWHWMPNHIG